MKSLSFVAGVALMALSAGIAIATDSSTALASGTKSNSHFANGTETHFGPETGSYMTLQVESGQKECLFEELRDHDLFEMWFEVIRGDQLDIKFQLLAPNSQFIIDRYYSFSEKSDQDREKEGHVSLKATTSGEYSFCFDNTLGHERRTISFYVRDIPGSSSQIRSVNRLADDIAKIEHLGPMWDLVLQLDHDLDIMQHALHYMRVREQEHRDTAESTNRRVLVTTIVESLLLISISLAQLIFIRLWFREKEIRRPRV